jgi:GAF domain-containing protein
MADDRLEQSIESLSKLLLTDEPLEDALRRVTELVVHVLPGCDAVDVTLVVGEGDPRRVDRRDVHSDPDGPNLDDVQLRLRDGPMFEAMGTCRPVRIESTRDDEHWPEFCSRAADASVASCLVVPMTVRGECIGALSLYGRRERAFDDESERVAELVSAQAAIALANAQLHQACVDLTGQLEQALESRSVIDQAKGVLMERRGVAASEAFEELRRRSQHENRKVRELAQELVDSAVRVAGSRVGR